MANSSVVTIQMKVKSEETLDVGIDAVSTDPKQTHEYGDSNLTLNASSIPVVSQTWSDTVALAAGVKTLDLAALVPGNGSLPTIDMTGEKVQAVYIKNTGTNAMVFAPGGTNPYDLFGSASDRITLKAGGAHMWRGNEHLEDVDATHKTIDVAGTGSEEFEILLASG